MFNKYKLYTTNIYVEMLAFSYSLRFNAVLSHVNSVNIRHTHGLHASSLRFPN